MIYEQVVGFEFLEVLIIFSLGMFNVPRTILQVLPMYCILNSRAQIYRRTSAVYPRMYNT